MKSNDWIKSIFCSSLGSQEIFCINYFSSAPFNIHRIKKQQKKVEIWTNAKAVGKNFKIEKETEKRIYAE